MRPVSSMSVLFSRIFRSSSVGGGSADSTRVISLVFRGSRRPWLKRLRYWFLFSMFSDYIILNQLKSMHGGGVWFSI